jgi:hypothetical protein
MSQQILRARRSGGVIVVAGLAAALLLAPPLKLRATVHAADVIERFTASAVNMSGVGRSGAGVIEIGIERWSTEAERDRLLNTLMEKGQDKLLDQLQDLPRVGYIRTPNSLGWDLHYARSVKRDDGSRQVVIATDRPMSFWEAANKPRSSEYPFTLIDIRFDPDGKGVGKLAVASKITANKKTGTIEIENFGIEPVRLTEVRTSAGS